MRKNLPYIIVGVIFLFIVFLLFTSENDSKKTVKENTTIAANEAEEVEIRTDIQNSQDCSEALAAHYKEDSIERAKLKNYYEIQLKKRAARVRVPVTAPNAERVAQLRELSSYFQSEEFKRAVNNRTN